MIWPVAIHESNEIKANEGLSEFAWVITEME